MNYPVGLFVRLIGCFKIYFKITNIPQKIDFTNFYTAYFADPGPDLKIISKLLMVFGFNQFNLLIFYCFG